MHISPTCKALPVRHSAPRCSPFLFVCRWIQRSASTDSRLFVLFSRGFIFFLFPLLLLLLLLNLLTGSVFFFPLFTALLSFVPRPTGKRRAPRASRCRLSTRQREIGRARAPGRKNFNSIPWLRYSCLSLFTFGKPVLSVCCWASVLYAPHRPVFLFFSGLFFLVTPPQQHLTDAVTLFAYGSRSTMSRGRQQKTRHQRRHLTRGGGGQ